MMLRRIFSVVSALLISTSLLAYRIETGDVYVGAGVGVNVNVARFDSPNKTPGAELPLVASLDYVWEKNWGVFASVLPTFSPGSVGFGLRAGAKYWFKFIDAPLYPYASLALAPSFLIPFKTANHFNLGISPGVGVNYFIMAKFIVGAHLHVNPALAFADGEKKFEFAVMPFFDLNVRL